MKPESKPKLRCDEVGPDIAKPGPGLADGRDVIPRARADAAKLPQRKLRCKSYVTAALEQRGMMGYRATHSPGSDLPGPHRPIDPTLTLGAHIALGRLSTIAARETVRREASMRHITLPVDGSGRTWCSRRLACVALGDISDAELDALINAEPEALAERAKAQSTSAVPVSLDECTGVLGASWADEARRVARACGCTVTSVIDGAYAEAIRQVRDLLPPIPGPPP